MHDRPARTLPTLISGDAARPTTWSGGTCSIKLTSPRRRALTADCPGSRRISRMRLIPSFLAAAAGWADLAGRRHRSGRFLRSQQPGKLGRRAKGGGFSRQRRCRWVKDRRAAAARPDPLAATMHRKDRLLTRGRSRPVADHAAVETGVGRANRPQEPRSALERRMVEAKLQPRLVGDFDPVEKVGPAGLVPQRMRIGAIDQVAPDVNRRDRPRAVRPVEARPDLQDQSSAQIRRFNRLAASWPGLFPCRASSSSVTRIER